ncbi:winged helix-turn-helix transcriptional regulator [Bifidobacterium subtile]|jgi:DNA-binding HxlR family transcriptional regulator|nr:helix-turn-helix domain-containing protein [Bifidobacterium subtile]MCI1223540.1 helix-turn-helix transcriptional regulator [Bifidobacterium subtile]MCI1241880.1 helix-turn-helix transcriptional regulator [Bifidobacterium subtile]QOL36100.1 helix-turn-helix transcriptional regulator [Bifidobacterium subtile]
MSQRSVVAAASSAVSAAAPADACARNDVYAAMCPCRDMLDLLANKWSALAIGALEDGPLRFGQLRRLLEGISPKVLSHTLKRLEAEDLITRTVYAEVPTRVEYALTDFGRSASVPLKQLRDWVEASVGVA